MSVHRYFKATPVLRIQRTFSQIAAFKNDLFSDSEALEHHMQCRFPELAADIAEDAELVAESKEQLEAWLKEVGKWRMGYFILFTG